MNDNGLTQADMVGIKKDLEERRDYLRNDIQRELRKLNSETYDLVADRVADPGEQSVTDLILDLNLAEIERDTEELKDVEDALSRWEAGSFGVCADCGEDVEAERLKEYPAARRCLQCQERFENRNREQQHRTL